ncbi:hypothetical protein [Aeromicrobium stalagmiti]|uniref:hypothetical protein n=1 Tax=Aeromicrobium stalagmiti TaxID=2738988 RepID=UPI001569D0B1|nr:hypothetical protein [Aeromicrobium stalagmiti]NRQ51564.1 hypothetical protein [Aeromicrobium stalagmiti]
MTEPNMTPEKTELGWKIIWDEAQTWQTRSDTQDAWKFAPGSKLAGDNKRTKPFQTSHACRAVIHAAVDHQHAVGALVMDAHALHTYAGATLVRAAIESASFAIWMLEPESKEERALRTFKWSAKDYADELRFEATSMGKPTNIKAAVVERFGPAVERAGLSIVEVVKGVQSTEAVRAADAYAVRTGEVMRPMLYWQLASGFAHGRRWSTLAFAERQERDTDDPDVLNVRFSMSQDRVLQLAFASSAAIEMAIGLWESRAARAVPPRAKAKR